MNKRAPTIAATANRILSNNRITMRLTPWLAFAGLGGCAHEAEPDVADQQAQADAEPAEAKETAESRQMMMFALKATLLLFGGSAN